MNNNAPVMPVSRRPLAYLMLLFFVPLAIAFLLYYGGSWRPAQHTEHGDLIQPARPLPAIAVRNADSQATATTLLRERWSLLYVGNGQCDARCRVALADMQRVREMLGNDIDRVQSVLLAGEHCCDESLRTAYPKLTVFRVDGAAAAPFFATFPVYGNVPIADAGRIYIVDPLGNLMMSYAPNASSIGLYQDIKHLLELSHIG